ncbi:type IV secretion protein Rhs, partial [Salmonella enterica subsp. salamae]|nr:type IV secretion protein Rhs [Salmonella enterica subsp. salamae]
LNGGGSAGTPVSTLQPGVLGALEDDDKDDDAEDGKDNGDGGDDESGNNKALCLSCLMDAAMNGTPVVLRGN